MKINQSNIVYGILTAVVIIPFGATQAIQGPPDNANPPAEFRENQARMDRGDQNKLPFLGIVSDIIPELLTHHLGLEDGKGVLIRTVCPDSPADKAGISVNDIVLSIADQPVGSSEDVTAIVRKHKIGDRIPLQLIHKGKPSRVELTLTERPADENLLLDDHKALLQGLPDEQAARLRQLLEQNMRGLDPQFFEDQNPPDVRMNRGFRMLRDRMNKKLLDIPELQIPEGGLHESTMRMNDNQGSIEIKTIDGKTEATVRDSEGTTIWSGNWTTEDDKASAPPQIRERIDRMQNGNGFSFQFLTR